MLELSSSTKLRMQIDGGAMMQHVSISRMAVMAVRSGSRIAPQARGAVACTAMAAMLMLISAPVAFCAGLTDPQIAHIAYTAGQIDIEAGKLALSKSKNKDVRAFAEAMVNDHTAVNKQALDLVTKLKVTPEDNDTSRGLTKQAADKSAELAKLEGTAFDKAYIANEVAYHKTVNGALEKTLIPSATNPALESLLQTGLKIFQGHQQRAEQVAAELK
jgi:putative membrane protein